MSDKAYRDANREKVLAGKLAYREANRELLRAKAKDYYARNKEKAAAYREATREHISAKNKKWRDANPDRRATLRKHWQSENRGKTAQWCREREAIKLQAVPPWSSRVEIDVVYAKARQWSRILCVPLHVDHCVPLKSKLVCGLHCIENLQLLAASDNVRKSNRLWPDMP